jgi:hypothetical protein
MSRHVGYRRRVTGGPRCRYCSGVGDISSRGVPARREGPDRPDPHLAPREPPEAVDGLAGPCVARSVRLEQRKHALGTVSRPTSQHAAVVLAQRQRARSAVHAKELPRDGMTRWDNRGRREGGRADEGGGLENR